MLRVEIWCLVSPVELKMMVLITSLCTSYSQRMTKRMNYIEWQNKPYTQSSHQSVAHLKRSNKQNKILWVFLCLKVAYLQPGMVYQLQWAFVPQMNSFLKMSVNHVPLEWAPFNPKLLNASRVTKCGLIQEIIQTRWNTSFRLKSVKSLKQSKKSYRKLRSKKN